MLLKKIDMSLKFVWNDLVEICLFIKGLKDEREREGETWKYKSMHAVKK